ncbi:PIG-L family deacetylase [Paenibacillus xerothermodurans]|nr:PIG-L family deacetylase [Paenibacillus xerothermodurans]
MYTKLMIVAHPDDESIFGGTQLLQSKGWKVICVTNGYNPVRRKEFAKAMAKAGALFEIWKYRDRRHGGFDCARLTVDLKQAISRKTVAKVVTHNLNGEYGHNQHKVLSKLVHTLVAKNLYVFDPAGRRLDKRLLTQKKTLLAMYTSQKFNLRKFTYYVEHEGLKRVK